MTGFEFLPLLSFKVVVTALVVVAISAVIEHSGPVVGGVLPITAGPGYAFLALQSTPHFVAQSALFSFAIVSANMIYVAIYLLAVAISGHLRRRRSVLPAGLHARSSFGPPHPPCGSAWG